MYRSPKKISEVYQEPAQGQLTCSLELLATTPGYSDTKEREIEFQIDTGAEANVIPERAYMRIGSPSLSPVMQTIEERDSHQRISYRKAQEGKHPSRPGDLRG